MMTVEFYLFNPLHILIMCANIRSQNIIPHYQKGVLSMAVTVSVTLTDEEYEEVLVKSKAIGLSVAQYVKKYPISVDDFDSRYSYLKEQALLQPAGVPFTVMSLFDDWDTIPRGVKLSLGRNFYHLVKRETQELIQIKPAGKTSSNVQLYVKEG